MYNFYPFRSQFTKIALKAPDVDPDLRVKLEESLCGNPELKAMLSKGIELIRSGIKAKLASNPEAEVITRMIMKLVSEQGDKKVIKAAVLARLREHDTDLDLERWV